MEWKEDLADKDWDEFLIFFNGHPLQSTTWGNARLDIEGIKDYRWAVFNDNKIIYIVRFEERRIFKFLKIAWIPQEISINDVRCYNQIQKELFIRLRKKGFFICVTSPWRKIKIEEDKSFIRHTIWINLNDGKEKIWKNLGSRFRNDIKRAKKMGIIIELTNDKKDIIDFYKICKITSNRKEFKLQFSLKLLLKLLNSNSSNIKSFLFVAKYNNIICSGAFIIRCGESIHYIFGTNSRLYKTQRAGEALHWAIIEWAITHNCKKYDLEGVYPHPSDGNYIFKKKLRGELIILPGWKIYILNPFLNFFSKSKILVFMIFIYHIFRKKVIIIKLQKLFSKLENIYKSYIFRFSK